MDGFLGPLVKLLLQPRGADAGRRTVQVCHPGQPRGQWLRDFFTCGMVFWFHFSTENRCFALAQVENPVICTEHPAFSTIREHACQSLVQGRAWLKRVSTLADK